MSRARAGFSLIELMVTIAVSLLLLVGIARVFLTSKQSYRVQEGSSRMQENIRIASEYFNRHLRVADFWGGAPADAVQVLAGGSYAGRGGCNQLWITDPAAGVIGYAGGSGNPAGLPIGCLTRYVDGSDALVLRGAAPDEAFDEAGLATAAGQSSRAPFYVRARLGRGGLLFHRSSLDAARTALPCTTPRCGITNHRLAATVFYVQTSDFGSGPVPTLSMLRMEADALETEPLVDGIEMLAFSYGLDSDDDRQIDAWREAAAVTDWRRVLGVRVSFVARGDQLDSVVDDNIYPLGPGRCYGPPASDCTLKYSAAAARFQRRLVVQDVLLRNRVRT